MIMRELAITAIRDPVLLATCHVFVRIGACASDPAAIASGCLRLVWALLGGLLVLAPAIASADLYKWTDERGTTVLSNVPPPNPRRVTNFEVVVKESAGAPAPRVSSSQQHDVTVTEKLLLDRIDSLERQIQAQQSARETSIVAASPPNPSTQARMPEYAATLSRLLSELGISVSDLFLLFVSIAAQRSRVPRARRVSSCELLHQQRYAQPASRCNKDALTAASAAVRVVARDGRAPQ